jgi:hypothetical protein
MKPAEICLREAWSIANCRSSAISEPLPNEFVREAWKARVGYSVERDLTHAA